MNEKKRNRKRKRNEKEGNEETRVACSTRVFYFMAIDSTCVVRVLSAHWFMKCLARHPLTLITILGLLLAWLVFAAGWQYDSPGLPGVAFWASWLLASPVWAVGEVGQTWWPVAPSWLVIVVALVLCWSIEIGVRRLVLRWRRKSSSGA